MANLTYINNAIFEHGAISQLGEVLEQQGIRRPLICTDPGLARVGLLDKVRGAIPNSIQYALFDRTPPNPTQEAVEEAIELYRSEGCDGIIGFGGGSSMDLGKAVGVLAAHGGSIDEYSVTAEKAGFGAIVPLVAIPTTSGTGSEVSNGSVIIMKSGRKLILGSPHIVPRAAICDPDLTLGLPPALTAGAGMDAMTHCIEAVLTPVINPPAEAVGLDGLERGFRNGHLRRAVADGSDPDARWNMMMASTEGAMAFTKGLGAVHCMSHACGALRDLGLHHGTLNGVILPSILRFNAQVDGIEAKYARIARAMGLDESVDLADFIEKSNAEIGLPPDLKSMGVTEDHVEFLVDHSLEDICNFTTPRQPTREEYEQLFAQLL